MLFLDVYPMSLQALAPPVLLPLAFQHNAKCNENHEPSSYQSVCMPTTILNVSKV